MNEAVLDPTVESVLARFDAAVDDLMTLRLDVLSGDDLVALASRFETAKRRLPVVDHRLIAQAQTRNLDFAHGAKNLADFPKQSLRITGREASARVRAAEAAGPRTALTGEQLPPIYPEVAAAQAAGAICPEHARVIVRTVDRLPGAIGAEFGPPSNRSSSTGPASWIRNSWVATPTTSPRCWTPTVGSRMPGTGNGAAGSGCNHAPTAP